MKSIREEWRDIESFQGRYKVSSFGNILSTNYNLEGLYGEINKKVSMECG